MSDAPKEAAPASPPGGPGWSELWRRGLLAPFVLLMLGVWLNSADTLVTVTVMPSVAREIGGYAYFGWATGAFLLGAITSGAGAGALSRSLGLKAAMCLAGLIYAIGCALDGGAPTILTFLVGRLIQGVGGGAIIGLAFVAVGAVFPERLWARVFSAIAGVWGIATVVGPLVGGLFAGGGRGAWRAAFGLFALQGLIFLLAAARLLPSRTVADPGPKAVPWRQLLAVSLGVLSLAAAGVVPEGALAALLALLGCAALAGAVWIDAGRPDPMLPRDARRLSRPAGAGYLMIFLMQAGVVVWSIYGGAFLQAVDGASPLVSGYVVSGEAIGWTLLALAVASEPGRREGALIRAGPILAAGGLLILALSLQGGGLLGPAIGSLVIGAGFGLCWSFLNRRILSSLPERERAQGSSAIPTVQMIGNAVGAAAASALADLLGFGVRIGADNAGRRGPLLLAAFLPLLGLATLCAFRLAGGEKVRLSGEAEPSAPSPGAAARRLRSRE